MSRSSDLQAIMTEANSRFQSGDYEEAVVKYLRGLEISRARGDAFNAARFLTGIGNYHVLTHRYDQAAAAFEQASTVARAARNAEFAVKVAVNRATLYRRMGEKKAAVEAMREVRDSIPSNPPTWLLIQAGNLATDDIGIEKAAPYFLAAADRAAADGDVSTQASALAQLGYLSLAAGRLDNADRWLTEAFRLRRMAGNRQTGSLYMYLSMLRREQGDMASALNLIDRALEIRTKAIAVAPPFLHYQRARVLSGSGRFDEAIAEYQTAVDFARDWRLRLVPSDTFRIGADVTLQDMYSGYIEALMASFRKTGQADLERRSFELAEMNRAASLREALRQRALPARYWETVENLRKAIIAGTSGDAAANARADELRKQLFQQEQESDCIDCQFSHQIKERTYSENSLSRLQHNLGTGEALLSFHTAEPASYVWAMTRETFESHILPGRKEIAAAASAFRASLEADSGSTAQSGEKLHRRLFGPLSSHVKNKTSWILSVDEPMHGIPFSALPATGNANRFLVESHTIRIVPGAQLMMEKAVSKTSDRFVGFADGIYNGADPRLPAAARTVASDLPRLPGTRQEVSASVASWGPNHKMYTGAELTSDEVRRVMSGTSAVVHFGSHVVADRTTRGGIAMALGLNNQGTLESLTPTQIAGWNCGAGVVVLSGCHSGTGEALPGAGLVGLTRAWLLAGAHSVTATHWPITDDAQAFFKVFYKHLRGNLKGGLSASATAESLRAAQTEMLRGGGSNAKPAYWAAFFVVGKD